MKTLSFLVFCIFVVAGSAFAGAPDVEFVIDISGSMKQKLNGETQIDSARKALQAALQELSPESLVALRVYGHRVEQSNKAGSCQDTELVVPFQKLNPAAIIGRANTLTPRGYTPIALSLRETKNDLLDVGIAREADRVIILLTDGEETCGGDPVAEINRLKAEGFQLKVYTVGFNVNDVGRRQLEAIAVAGNGKYFDAKNAAALTSSLQQVAKETATIAKEKKTYGDAIRGGNSYEDAVAIPFDKELRLDHHQKKNDFDYFYFDASPADQITFTLATLEKGVYEKAPGTMVETDHPYAGFHIDDSVRQKIQAKEIIGTRNGRETIQFRVPTAGRFYVLVGSIYESQNKDHTTFQIKKETKGDLGTTSDAGVDVDQAMALTGEKFSRNYIGGPDKVDLFSFEAKKGEVYIVGIVPTGKPNGYFTAKVFDEFKQEITRQSSRTSGSGMKSDPFTIPDDGIYYLEISYLDEDLVEYSFILRKNAPAAPAATPPPATEGPSAPVSPTGPTEPAAPAEPVVEPVPTDAPTQ